MKKQLLGLAVLLLLGTVLLGACASAKQTPTNESINVPLVSGAGATQPVESTAQGGTYPIESQAAVPAVSAQYPASSTVPQTDDEMKTFIEGILQGHHTIDFLLQHNYSTQEWVDVLNKDFHADVTMTVEQRDAVIAWLIKNKK